MKEKDKIKPEKALGKDEVGKRQSYHIGTFTAI